MIPENTELLAKITSKEATRDEIRLDLEARCAEIPVSIWFATVLEGHVAIHEYPESPLLPKNDSYETENGSRHVGGHDVVWSVLARNGRILEKLVHYASDNLDPLKVSPDEVLGEAGDEVYRRSYRSAVLQLDMMLEEARTKKLVWPGV